MKYDLRDFHKIENGLQIPISISSASRVFKILAVNHDTTIFSLRAAKFIYNWCWVILDKLINI
jgi:hypothetical protein